MKKLPFAIILLSVTSLFCADDWTQFRGPNSSGVSERKNLPAEFGPKKNVLWKTDLPPGHSSPILSGDRIYLTAIDNEKLFTICLDRETGKINWRREVPRDRKGELHKVNGPASPSPTSDGKNVFVFYYDFGLVSYGPDGNERWRWLHSQSQSRSIRWSIPGAIRSGSASSPARWRRAQSDSCC